MINNKEIKSKIAKFDFNQEEKDMLIDLIGGRKLGVKLYYEHRKESKYGIELNQIYNDNYVLFTEEKDLRISNSDKKENLIIEGDNFFVLNGLNDANMKFDLIYIDPPYNRGQDFIYNDKYINNDDKFKHSTYLSFMKERLLIAKKLLSMGGGIANIHWW